MLKALWNLVTSPFHKGGIVQAESESKSSRRTAKHHRRRFHDHGSSTSEDEADIREIERKRLLANKALISGETNISTTTTAIPPAAEQLDLIQARAIRLVSVNIRFGLIS